MTADEARELLGRAGLFYGDYDDDDESPKMKQTLNMNDTWFWATAFGEEVTDDELPEVARLFRLYGWCGVLYWVSEKNDQMRAEFEDVNRFVDFVRAEEAIAKEIPSSSKRAYHKASYTLPDASRA